MGEDDILRDRPDAHGYIDYVARRIVVRGVGHPSFVTESLLHEVLHAVTDDASLQDVLCVDDEFVEKLVGALTPRLLQLLKDNPQLVSKITQLKDNNDC